MENLFTIIFAGLGLFVAFVVLVILLGLLTAIPVWFLYNWLVPIIFVTPVLVPHISLLQAFGISLLCGLLFRSTTSNTSKK